MSGDGPLSGLLVADFSRIVAGPYCTMLLGDLGAEVIKVESPAGDDTRTFKPPVRDEESTYYLAVNRNKRSVALDLADKGDLVLARRLAHRADVLVHNFKPGTTERYDLGYEQVAAANPGLVYCAISGFGTRGGAALPGYDLLIQAASGMMAMTGEADGAPLRTGISAIDVMTGLHAAVAVLAALNHRTATGHGQLLEIDLLSSALSSMINQSSAWVAGGVVPQRMGNEHPSLFPYGPLPTADRELIVVAGNDRQYRTLCDVLGRPDLAADPRFASVGLRNDHRDELRPELEAVLATRGADEWAGLLTRAGLPCGPINDVRRGVETATRLGLEPVVDVEGVPMVRNPVTYSLTPPRYRHRPPALDNAGESIRAWLASEVSAKEPLDA
ncbi:carnitine dehydratase [Streptomyces dioscori]|uniref:Carnitine dehydratase n=1 Tax=Streptomyces dioscori TaxID=2109333 RepID=A0A2P8PYD6_9ACTN|nr:CoA transferase [Streptomyces dioscori]PSM39001.1 carnitine dehydratase [Streptomyces dioscori]